MDRAGEDEHASECSMPVDASAAKLSTVYSQQTMAIMGRFSPRTRAKGLQGVTRSSYVWPGVWAWVTLRQFVTDWGGCMSEMCPFQSSKAYACPNHTCDMPFESAQRIRHQNFVSESCLLKPVYRATAALFDHTVFSASGSEFGCVAFFEMRIAGRKVETHTCIPESRFEGRGVDALRKLGGGRCETEHVPRRSIAMVPRAPTR